MSRIRRERQGGEKDEREKNMMRKDEEEEKNEDEKDDEIEFTSCVVPGLSQWEVTVITWAHIG